MNSFKRLRNAATCYLAATFTKRVTFEDVVKLKVHKTLPTPPKDGEGVLIILNGKLLSNRLDGTWLNADGSEYSE